MASLRAGDDEIELIGRSQIYEMLNKGGIEMAKKPLGQPEPKAKRDVSRYFPTQVAVQTNKVVKTRFDLALATVAARGNLNLLDQSKLSSQAVYNLLMLWFARKVEEGKAAWLEKELGPVMEELAGIVAKEMIERGREVDPAYLPEGFAMPKKRRKEGDDA